MVNFRVVEQKGMSLKQQNQIVEDYEKGETVKALAEHNDCTRNAIRRILKREKQLPMNLKSTERITRKNHPVLKFIYDIGVEYFFRTLAKENITLRQIDAYFHLYQGFMRNRILEKEDIMYNELKKELGTKTHHGKSSTLILNDKLMNKLFGKIWRQSDEI